LRLAGREPIRRWLGVGALALFFLCNPAVADDDAHPVVVTNPRVAQVKLRVNTLRAMFGMRVPVWPNGTPVKVFVLNDDDPLHAAFSKRVLNLFPHQLRQAWNRLVFSGTGQAPTQVESEEQMRARVASTPGAIGYLREATTDDRVRVLEVE
jgi:hypothetical protein